VSASASDRRCFDNAEHLAAARTREIEMKSKVLAAMLVALGVAALFSGAARAQHLTVRIDTPEFGIRIGHPGYRPAPVFVPAPVYIPPPIVRYPAVVYPYPIYGHPRVIHAPPPFVWYSYPGHGHRHEYRDHRGRDHGHDRDDDHRNRHRGHEGRVIDRVQIRTH
jgi:hypothetical protein